MKGLPRVQWVKSAIMIAEEGLGIRLLLEDGESIRR